MAPQIVNIAAMTPSKARYKLTARATRVWVVSPNQNAKPLSLDMVLLDSEGNHIQATIPQKWIQSYKDDINEGTIYQLSHFDVAKNNKGYKPVRTNENIIRFTPFTTIDPQSEDSIKIEKHKFEFHRLDKIHERHNKTDYLIDIIGVLAGVENKTQVRTENGMTDIRNIYIEDERQNEVQATLWGDAANYVTETDTQQAGINKIIVITSTRVARYKDEYQLKSTYGTKVYINPQIPEAQELLDGIAKPITARQLESNTKEQLEDAMQANRKTLLELTDMEITDQKNTYSCEGEITSVRTDVDWRYISCPTCRKGLKADNYCSKCVEEIPYPTQRYRLQATLDDGTTEASIVIFDKEAEKVIGKPISKLIDLCEKVNGKQKVYEILQSCVGKRYTFKVMLGTTTYADTRELKVVKTYLNNETAAEPKAVVGEQDNTMEPKTPEKDKRKKQTREEDSQGTSNEKQPKSQANKRQRSAKDPQQAKPIEGTPEEDEHIRA